MKNLIKILGSLNFALFLIASLVAVLTVSTLLESAYGTPFVQRLFYQAGWFDAFLGLVGVNILCSALSRWPYKLSHTGFLTTHAGILLLLAGSLLTRLTGVEGQMALMEGEQKDRLLQQDYQLVVHEPEKKVKLWDLKSFSPKRKTDLALTRPGRKLTLERIEEGVTTAAEVRAGGAEKNRAVHFTLESATAELHESFWLVENSPDPAFGRRLSVGLADIELKETKPAGMDLSSPQVRITHKKTGRVYTVPLTAGKTKDASFKDIGLSVTDITYYPDARVGEDNRLVNASDEPKNPAVRFTLQNAEGAREEKVLFSLFPDFESLHGRKSESFAGLKAELIAPESELAAAASKSGLVFYMPGERWTYESRSKNGKLAGDVKTGEDLPTGWMDFTFRVDRLLDDAVVEKKMMFTGNPKKGDLGTLLSLSQDGKTLGSQWVLQNEPVTFQTPEGPLTAVVGLKSVELPFRLKLLDFRKQDYPGTENAASYESDVALEDPVENVRIQKRIWMNHPLDYKGYRIFQSSFIQDPEAGETSIFTIAKDPGIVFIYGGAIIMFLGVVCVFYIKPLSYFSARSSHAGKKK